MAGSSSSSPFRRTGSSGRRTGSSSGSGGRGNILPPIFAPGDTVANRYRIIRFVGRGGMGEVYEAEDLDLQVRVALKTVRPEIADHDGALDRFRREIQLARKVTHPNVCRIFDVGRHQIAATDQEGEREIVFLTMEHLEGPTLATSIRKEGRMEEEIALPVIEQMAAAIDAAHEAGIVHRDFKSSNVILVPDVSRPGGIRAVVTDFGLARGIQPEDALSTSLSSSSQTVGTPTYMAPEQVAGAPITPSVDIYALGIVVFEMITGRPPFVSDSPLSIAVKRLIEPPPSPRSFAPDLGTRLETGILRCLERDPDTRFQQASDLVRWIRSERLSNESLHPVSRRVLIAMALVILLLAAGGTYVWLQRHALAPIPGAPQERMVAAVFGFRNLTRNSDAAWLSTALQEMLSMELAASEDIRVVPGDTVARVRTELGITEDGPLSTRQVRRIARNLDADVILFGSYFMEDHRDDAEIRLAVRIHRAGDDELIPPVIETGRRSALIRLVSAAGEELRSKLGIVEEMDTTTALAAYPSDPEATMLYAQGLKALRRGDPVRARDHLERSIEIEGRNPLAYGALASAWSSLGYDTKAREAAREAMNLSEGLSREERLLIEARYHESASDWDRAVEIYERLRQIAPDELEYGLALARAQALAGDPASLRTIESIRPMTGERVDPRIALTEATAAEALGNFAHERRAARLAAEQSRAIGAWVLLAKARLAEWWAERNMGNLDAANRASSEALEIARRVDDRSLVAQALNAIATTRRQMGNSTEARRLDLESLQVFREIGDKRREAWALNNLGRAAYEEGDFEEALRFFGESLEIVREIDDSPGISRALGNMGNILHEKGWLDESEALFREMLEIARESGDQRSLHWARTNLAGTLADSGRTEEARRLIDEAIRGFRETGERRGEGWALSRRGELQLYANALETAERDLRESLRIFVDTGDQRATCSVQVRLARALEKSGRLEQADALLDEARELQRLLGDRYGEAVNLLWTSRVALSRGDAGGAAELAIEAATMFRSQQLPNKQAEALAALSRAQLAQGDPASARVTVEEAMRLTDPHGDVRLDLRLQMASNGVRAAAGATTAVTGLRRSKEVATRLGYHDLASEAARLIESIEA